MAYLSTHEALHYVLLFAFTSLVADLVALETELSVTVMRLVAITSAKNAIQSTSLIRTLLCHVAKLFAISTLYCWV